MRLRLHNTHAAISVGHSDAASHRDPALAIRRGGVRRMIATLVMVSRVFSRRHQLQIRALVVLLVAVEVMHVFAGQQDSSEVLLNDQAVLCNESVNRMWMRRAVNTHVPSRRDDASHADRSPLAGASV